MTQPSETPATDRTPSKPADDRSWPERHVNLIIVALVVACGLTLVAQARLGLDHDHHPPHFEQETWFGFEAGFGFAAFLAVVLLGAALRVIIARPEDYYDE